MTHDIAILRPTSIIACEVFKDVLGHLNLSASTPNIRLRLLPSTLHLDPVTLQKELTRHFRAARNRRDRIVCLYGDCFPGIGESCKSFGAIKVSGCHCYEILLGSRKFRRIIEETTGTYFLERQLIEQFDKYCAEPMELHDEEVRRLMFQHYRQVVYVRQPSDGDLLAEVARVAELLELAMEVRDADYSHLEKQLKRILHEELLGCRPSGETP
ncbi:DUF1638 domain-containing protein [Thermodesulfobacteriota bacterium]